MIISLEPWQPLLHSQAVGLIGGRQAHHGKKKLDGQAPLIIDPPSGVWGGVVVLLCVLKAPGRQKKNKGKNRHQPLWQRQRKKKYRCYYTHCLREWMFRMQDFFCVCKSLIWACWSTEAPPQPPLDSIRICSFCSWAFIFCHSRKICTKKSFCIDLYLLLHFPYFLLPQFIWRSQIFLKLRLEKLAVA